MKHSLVLTSSLVLYNNNSDEILNLLDLLVKSSLSKIFVIDNSISPIIFNVQLSSKIEYLHSPDNPGFGKSHNVGILKSIDFNSEYHFIINPDIVFKEDVFFELANFAETDSSIGMVMPRILNMDGGNQFLPKLFPNPFSIIYRKIKWPHFLYNIFIDRYELRFVDENKIYLSPIISGCFCLLKIDAIKKVGGFDDDYFMYFEDWDLSRRIGEQFKTIYYPLVAVYHGYDSGANKSIRLLLIYLKSAILYFNKWGWFFDKNRRRINKRTLDQFR